MKVQMYNVIYCSRVGDKVLKAQTENPYSFVEMHYPSAIISDETGEDTTWTMDDGTVTIESTPVRNISLDVLLPETEYNKIMKL